MRRMLLAIIAVLLVGGVLIAAGALLYSQRTSLGQIYTDGQSIRTEADSAPIRQMLWRDPILFKLPVDLRGASELQLSASGDVIIFVRGTPDERLNLFESHNTPTGWTDAKPIGALNTRDNELSPALSPDGFRLVFASDRTGGKGGYDLWWSQRSHDGAWSAPVNAGAINSTAHDYAAAFTASGGELYLTSDREIVVATVDLNAAPEESAESDQQWTERLRASRAPRIANIFTVPVGQTGFGTARIVHALRSDFDDIAPAFSPAGDFVYFSSNRTGGMGGFDLYRARIVDSTVLSPEPLGDPVNTPDDELDPMPWMDGFAVVYATAKEGSPITSLLEARSREVYLDRDAALAHQRSAAMWESLWPWILGLLLLVLLLLLLSGLLKASRSERMVRGWRRLSLFAKCLLASLAVHMLLMLLFAAWTVGSVLGDYLQRPQGTRIALLDRGAAGSTGDIAQQIRAAMTQATTDPAELAQRERAELALRPAAELSTQQMQADATAAQLAPNTQSMSATDARPQQESPAPEAAPIEVAQAESIDTSQNTPDAPAARSHTEELRTSPTPLETTPTEQAAMQSASPAQVEHASISPVESRQHLDAAPTQTQARSAVSSSTTNVPQQAAVQLLQADTIASAAVDTPHAARSNRVAESSQQDVASAASSPTTRPTSPVPATHQYASLQHMLAPASSAAPLLETTAVRLPPNVADSHPHPSTAMSESTVSIASTAPFASTMSTPEAFGTQPADAIQELAITMPALATAHGTSRAPIGATDATAHTPLATTTLAPTTTSHYIAGGQRTILGAGESELSNVSLFAQSLQGIHVDAQDTRVASSLHIPSAALHEAGAVEQSTQAPASNMDPLDQLRPTFSLAGGATTSAPLTAPDIGLAPRESTQTPQHIPAVAHAVDSQSALRAPAAPAHTSTIDVPVLASSAASTLGTPSSAAQIADVTPQEHADAGLANFEMPAPNRRAAVSAGDSSQPVLDIQSRTIAPERRVAVDLVAAPVLTTSLSDASPTSAIPALSSTTLAMTDIAPRAFAIPQLPRALQMYPQREEEARQHLVEQGGGSAETEAAVASALVWLATHQQGDGRWSGREFDDLCQCGGRSAYDFDKALTGLALLCFLATDNTHTQDGPYRDTVARAVRWLVNEQDEDGSLLHDESMYSHGIATIALCEAYGMSGDPALREPATKAIDFIVRSRNDVQGGWRYEPGQPGDTSVLGWQIMALESARRCGIDVPVAARDNARAWLEKVSLPGRPGLYTYQVGAPISMSMTAEAMFVQQLLGTERDEPRMAQSAQYILRELPDWNRNANTYGWYYATLALFQHRGDAWEQWNDIIVEQLVGAQREDGNAVGSWDPSDRWSTIGGRVYQTAICCLTLEVYYRYLPQFVDQP